jgi:hypothetical protein
METLSNAQTDLQEAVQALLLSSITGVVRQQNFFILILIFSIKSSISLDPDSVADPDPYVFGPLRSGSISTRYGSGSEVPYGSGSGSFYHQAKNSKENYWFVTS